MAASTWSGCFASTNIDPKQDVATFQCIVPLVSKLVVALFELAGVALFIMLLYGGFTFLLSSGDQKKLEQAHGTLTNAIIGLVVIVSSYLILKTIGVFTGTFPAITNFTIPK